VSWTYLEPNHNEDLGAEPCLRNVEDSCCRPPAVLPRFFTTSVPPYAADPQRPVPFTSSRILHRRMQTYISPVQLRQYRAPRTARPSAPIRSRYSHFRSIVLKNDASSRPSRPPAASYEALPYVVSRSISFHFFHFFHFSFSPLCDCYLIELLPMCSPFRPSSEPVERLVVL